MGTPPPSPPVITMNTGCPNGRQICPSGIPVQFLIMSDQVTNLVVSINNANAGSYSNVTSQAITITPNPNYNALRIIGSNSNGSTECICSMYGTTLVGENGSIGYFDQNEAGFLTFDPSDLEPWWSMLESAAETKMDSFVESLFEHPPTSLAGKLPRGIGPAISICLHYLGQSQSTNPNGNTPICIPNETLQACIDASDNQTSCSGSVYINGECINFNRDSLGNYAIAI